MRKVPDKSCRKNQNTHLIDIDIDININIDIDININIDIFVNFIWVDTRWQYTFTHKQYIEHHS
jgi:hypothetical protein